jgi:hypothetical protein
MNESVFFEGEVFAPVVFSILILIAIYVYMTRKRGISPHTVALLGIALIALAGMDLFLLQRLGGLAKRSPSLVDDRIRSSEVSAALYFLPALSNIDQRHSIPRPSAAWEALAASWS